MFLAGFAATNPLVFSAASTVAKKAFEAVASRSLRGISEVVSEHYKGNKEVLRLRDELELKVRILALPVDICVQQAVAGNSALQGVLDVALSVLRDIEDFEEGLSQQDVASGRGEGATPSSESHSAIAKKLEALIKQLDSVLPYLGVAISSVSLLDKGQRGFSPSRLLAASHSLRTAPNAAGSAVLRVPVATWHQEIQATTGNQRLMQNQFPLCSLEVVKQQGGSPVPGSCLAGASPGAELQAGIGYELLVKQDLNDSLYHDEGERPGVLRFPVQDIAHIGWATSHAMKLGDNDFTPALVLTVVSGVGGQQASESASSSSRSRSPARRMSFSSDRKPPSRPPPQPTPPCQRYALQLRRAPEPDSDADDPGSNAASASKAAAGQATPSVTSRLMRVGGATTASSRADPSVTTSEWNVLGELEYVLRLCILEVREELPHYRIKDERIAMALAGAEAARPAGRAASEQPAYRTPMGSEVDSLTRDFGRAGFGSPVI